MNDPYDRVGKSPLNNSPTKQLYSFPKADRFNQTHKPYSQALYYPKTMQTERATAFTHSKRLQESPTFQTPSPNKYHLKTEFDKNSQEKKGFGFGKQQRLGTEISKNQSSVTPGPGAYTYKIDKYLNLAFSMGSRLQDPTLKNSNPLGPGQYNISSLNLTGEYFNSKYKNSGCGKMSKSPRFGTKYDNTPGPGQYQAGHSTDLSKQGSYFNSRFKSSKAAKFSRSSRSPVRQRSVSPGPGSYHNFSQFGRRNKSALRL